MAYAARYGHQPLSELMALSERDLRIFCLSIQEILKGEEIPSG